MDSSHVAQILARVQATAQYKDEILALRAQSVLHDVFEERIKQLSEQTRYAQFLHFQREKYGISNGRIDVSLYRPGAANVHIEFIASCKNGHVFRDTSSLLASNADARLAVLIDEDVDADVAKHFFRAIPNGQVRHAYLRYFMLHDHCDLATSIIEELIAEAEFVTGISAPDGFHCELERPSITPGETLSVRLRNCPTDDVARMRIRSDFAVVPVWQGDLTSSAIDIAVKVPKSPLLRRGRCRLEVLLEHGPLISKSAYIDSDVKPMRAWSDKKAYRIGETVRIDLRDFPPDCPVELYLWQGSSGEGIARGQTDRRGEGNVSFFLDPLTSSGVLQRGKHKITARADGYPEPASCFIDVETEGFRISEIPIVGKGRRLGVETRVCSVHIANVKVRPYQIILDLSLMALIDQLRVIGIRSVAFEERWNAERDVILLLAAHHFHLRFPDGERGVFLPPHEQMELCDVIVEPVLGKGGSAEFKDKVTQLKGDERLFLRFDVELQIGHHSLTTDILIGSITPGDASPIVGNRGG